jgi:hypothetical protein
LATRWSDLATEARISPARGTSASLAWTGADGKPVRVAVDAPDLAGHPAVVTLRPTSGDNGPALVAALERLRSSGGGTLRMMPGNYPVAGSAGKPALPMRGLSDILVDGPGARIVFARWGDGILIDHGARIALRGLSLGYQKQSVLRATVRSGTLVPAQGQYVPSAATAHQVTTIQTPAASGDERRLLLGREGTPMTRRPGGSYSLGVALSPLPDGGDVYVKLTYYDGAPVRIGDAGDVPSSHDITLDGITVRDSAGGGVVVDMMARGLAVLNSQIGQRRPDGVATIAYDALHITAMTGDVLIQRNRFTGSADDAMNLSSPIYDLAPDAAGGATVGPKNQGVGAQARVALFDERLQLLGVTTLASRAGRDASGRIKVTFAPGTNTGAARYLRNMALLTGGYAVVGNDVAECHCHGLLAQGPNGLVRDNRFTGLAANAVRLVTSAWWKEGAGAQNLVVERNIIRDTGVDGRRGIVWAAITAYAELGDDGGVSQPAIAALPINDNIVIRDNDIAQVAQGCVSVASAVDVVVQANTCRMFNRNLNRSVLLVERTSVADGVRRLPAKTAYLARGDGIWIDPVSTARVKVAP